MQIRALEKLSAKTLIKAPEAGNEVKEALPVGKFKRIFGRPFFKRPVGRMFARNAFEPFKRLAANLALLRNLMPPVILLEKNRLHRLNKSGAQFVPSVLIRAVDERFKRERLARIKRERRKSL